MKKLNCAVLTGLLLALAQPAMAEMKEPKFTVGATGGVALTLSNPVYVGWRAGANVGFFVMPKLSLGALALVTTTGSSYPGFYSVSNFSLSLLFQAKYFLIAGLSVGVDAGPGLGLSTTTPASGPSVTTPSFPFAFGPNVAFDFPIIDMLSVGAESNLLFTTASFATPTVNILANVKFRM